MRCVSMLESVPDFFMQCLPAASNVNDMITANDQMEKQP